MSELSRTPKEEILRLLRKEVAFSCPVVEESVKFFVYVFFSFFHLLHPLRFV